MKAENTFTGEEVQIPEQIVERTEAMLSTFPPTNQRIVVDTMQWWLENVGACAIYKWLVMHLHDLEFGETLSAESLDTYDAAREQAEEIGLSVE